MRHALVTGTSSGIGGAIAARLLADGWQVTGVARRPSQIDHPGYHHIAADLITAAGAAAVLSAARNVTAFVHAAGSMETGALGALDGDGGERMWHLNVLAGERLANGLVGQLGSHGRIVMIGSRTAAGAAGRSQYAATKAALVAMVRSWAIELASRGITANVVAPAATETAMLVDPARASVPPKLPPIGRYIQPDEVAAAVAFLLSESAAAITGQTLTICGGSSL
jgi:NAD(P)-dependent dehydrogenase (short-subunit alcohol dehydrogenase family)